MWIWSTTRKDKKNQRPRSWIVWQQIKIKASISHCYSRKFIHGLPSRVRCRWSKKCSNNTNICCHEIRCFWLEFGNVWKSISEFEIESSMFHTLFLHKCHSSNVSSVVHYRDQSWITVIEQSQNEMSKKSPPPSKKTYHVIVHDCVDHKNCINKTWKDYVNIKTDIYIHMYTYICMYKFLFQICWVAWEVNREKNMMNWCFWQRPSIIANLGEIERTLTLRCFFPIKVSPWTCPHHLLNVVCHYQRHVLGCAPRPVDKDRIWPCWHVSIPRTYLLARLNEQAHESQWLDTYAKGNLSENKGRCLTGCLRKGKLCYWCRFQWCVEHRTEFSHQRGNLVAKDWKCRRTSLGAPASEMLIRQELPLQSKGYGEVLWVSNRHVSPRRSAQNWKLACFRHVHTKPVFLMSWVPALQATGSLQIDIESLPSICARKKDEVG